MAQLRGMDDEQYCNHYSYRLFKVHATAHFKDKMMPFAMLLGGLGEGGEAQGAVPIQHKTGPAHPGPDGRPGVQTAAYLPSWFQRKSGRRYNVVSNEGPLGALTYAKHSWEKGPAVK